VAIGTIIGTTIIIAENMSRKKPVISRNTFNKSKNVILEEIIFWTIFNSS